ncbi:MAG: aminodeoxychorismate/anthranilate synthase component II [candidate division KSB1 bacterium]
MLDNFDSFTYNLVQYFAELGAQLEVARNNEITLAEIRALMPQAIVLSPGPGNPDSAGIMLALISTFAGEIPMLGVCLGQQAIAQAFGGKVVRAPELLHGKTSNIHHNGAGLFAGLNNPFQAMRYHSLIVAPENLPACLQVTARTEHGLIMGLAHEKFPIAGVQFHPESILTEPGKELLKNFMQYYVK